MIPKSLDDKFKHGEFIGLTVREAAERNPRRILAMSNRGEIDLGPADIEWVKSQII